jgi:hypothetical protein
MGWDSRTGPIHFPNRMPLGPKPRPAKRKPMADGLPTKAEIRASFRHLDQQGKLRNDMMILRRKTKAA